MARGLVVHAAAGVALLFILGCDDGSVRRRGAVMGPEGGTVDLPGGGVLVIPPGALRADTAIEVWPTAPQVSESFAPAGQFVGFGPSGLQFASPVEVHFPVAEAQAGDARVAWSDDGERWRALASGVDPSSGMVVAQVTHFSFGGPVVWETETECEAAGGLLDASGDCVVCCANGAQALWATMEECEAESGEIVDPEFCPGVCCQRADGSYGMMSRTACAGAAGTSVSAGRCEPACCRNGEAYAVVTTGVCEDGDGEALADVSLCDDVCCTCPEDCSPSSRHACGLLPECTAAAVSECDDLCCFVFGAHWVYPRCLCLALGGDTVGSVDGCLRVCCETATDVVLMAPEACEAAGGSADVEAECEEFCCVTGLDAEIMTRLECHGLSGSRYPPSECVSVCCELPSGATEEMTAAACAAAAGTALGGPSCPSFCQGQPAGTVCREPDECHDYECDAAGACVATALKCQAGNACQVAACVAGRCTSETDPQYACSRDGDCLQGSCDLATCTCLDTCGDRVCDPGEDDVSCPGDCGCANHEGRLAGTPICTALSPYFTGYHSGPAPAGCWCDDACQWRPEGCCADKVERCGPRCGDGRCQRYFGLETCATCPEDCLAGFSDCPDLSRCGDGVCDGPGPYRETHWTCPQDCGCAAVDPSLPAGSASCSEQGYRAPDGCSCSTWPVPASVGCIDACVACDRCPPCGDGLCVAPESFASCPEDCDPPADDGVCTPGETALSWLELDTSSGHYECMAWFCGDKVCNASFGETAVTCPADCSYPTVVE